jgi:hypothetical protein
LYEISMIVSFNISRCIRLPLSNRGRYWHGNSETGSKG